jgi:hypothetical protein
MVLYTQTVIKVQYNEIYIFIYFSCSPWFVMVCFAMIQNDSYENRRSKILKVYTKIVKSAQIYILDAM